MNETTDQFAALIKTNILSRNATVPTWGKKAKLAIPIRVIVLYIYIRLILDTIGIKRASTMLDSGRKNFLGNGRHTERKSVGHSWKSLR